MHQVTLSLTAWTCAFSFSAATNYQLATAWKGEKINKQSQNSSAKTISCSFETKGSIICSLPRRPARLRECDEMSSCDMNRSQTDGSQTKKIKNKKYFMGGKCGKSWASDKHFLKLRNMTNLISGWWSEPYWSPRLRKLRDGLRGKKN